MCQSQSYRGHRRNALAQYTPSILPLGRSTYELHLGFDGKCVIVSERLFMLAKPVIMQFGRVIEHNIDTPWSLIIPGPCAEGSLQGGISIRRPPRAGVVGQQYVPLWSLTPTCLVNRASQEAAFGIHGRLRSGQPY